MFVILYLLDGIEQKVTEFRNDLRLCNGLDPSVRIQSRSKTLPDHGPPLIRLLVLIIAKKKQYSHQQGYLCAWLLICNILSQSCYLIKSDFFL
jgi:hypothetical protein